MYAETILRKLRLVSGLALMVFVVSLMSKARIAVANRSWCLALCAAGALLSASPTQAADSGKSVDPQSAYQRDRAACLRGDTSQDRKDCIRRMNGEGTTSASVQSGGIYQELVTPVDPAKGN